MRIDGLGRAFALAAVASLASVSMLAADDSINGAWAGKMFQSDSSGEIDYKMVLQIEEEGGETLYPDLDCGGVLLRVAEVNGYTIFSETITTGRVDADSGEGCIDGLLIVQPHGGELLVEWAGNYDGLAYVAHATLARPDMPDKN